MKVKMTNSIHHSKIDGGVYCTFYHNPLCAEKCHFNLKEMLIKESAVMILKLVGIEAVTC